jgi:hypothetical protein
MNKLAEIQQKLIAPKGQFNAFGKYKYRSCEDILEAVKPLLGDSVLLITDEIVLIGDRYYVKATVHLVTGDVTKSVSAYARESLDKKGMDVAQITGAASSYARKYALNGLFCIDDTKDPDDPNHPKNNDKPKPKPKPERQSQDEKRLELIGQEFFNYTTEHKDDLAEGFEFNEEAFTRIVLEGAPKTLGDMRNIIKNMPQKLIMKEKKK